MKSRKKKRVILKISGEAFSPPEGKGIDLGKLENIASDIAEAYKAGIGMGIVSGAGNLVRGSDYAGHSGIRHTTADYMGMLATTINALALRDALMAIEIPVTVVSATPLPAYCEHYYRESVLKQMDQENRIIIFAGGTGHPGVTTDMCAAIRANEIDAEIILKATKVDGVYDRDPEKDPEARKYDRLTLEEALSSKLGVIDLASLAFCVDRNIPIRVFNITKPGNLVLAVKGEDCGTLVESG